MPAQLDGIDIKLIVDTGSGISIIGGTFFHNFLQGTVKLNDTNSIALAANGESMTTRGEVSVTLNIRNKAFIHKFRVIEEVDNEAIV